MTNYYVNPEELRECAADYYGTVQVLYEQINKLRDSVERISRKNREQTESLIRELEKRAEELENLSLFIKKAADEYLQNEEDIAAFIRKRLFVNTDNGIKSLIIERNAVPYESSVLFSHLLDHSPMMENMMIKDAEENLNTK